MDVQFADGEELRTEISAKFRRDGVERELAAAGLRAHRVVDRPRRRLRALALDPRVLIRRVPDHEMMSPDGATTCQTPPTPWPLVSPAAVSGAYV